MENPNNPKTPEFLSGQALKEIHTYFFKL